MNLYSQKQRWKIILIILATLIVGLNFWYSGKMVRTIKQTERLKLKRWSNTIEQKAELVKYSQTLYHELEEEEYKKMDVFADAYQRLLGTNPYEDYTFISKIIKQNTSIPLIIVDPDTVFMTTRNLDLNYDPNPANPEHQKVVLNLIREKFTKYPPFVIYLDAPENISSKTERQLMFYNDSRIYSELKQNLTSIIASFENDIRENDVLAPVIYTNENLEEVITFGNLDSLEINTPDKLRDRIRSMAAENQPIEVRLGDEVVNYIFYENSALINQLKFYPIIQVAIVGIYILITYMLFSSFKRSEQNQVWAGMSKETAHQLGTPISSLMAWVELLKAQGVDESTLTEINKDIHRLNVITDRFSKIGSKPELKPVPVEDIVGETKSYLEKRLSKRVTFHLEKEVEGQVFVMANIPLFSWVIENMVKNAIDAMQGEGELTLKISENGPYVNIDISDTGKGIPSAKHPLVFEPGYTTKKRGWGLGLSLAKRIIKEYHNGRIFIKFSEMGKGTTFRVVLKKSNERV